MIWKSEDPKVVREMRAKRDGFSPVCLAVEGGVLYGVFTTNDDPTHFRAAFGPPNDPQALKILFKTAAEAKDHLETIARG